MNLKLAILVSIFVITLSSCKEQLDPKIKEQIISTYKQKIKEGDHLYVVRTYRKEHYVYQDPDLKKIRDEANIVVEERRAKKKKKREEEKERKKLAEKKRLEQKFGKHFVSKSRYSELLTDSQILCNSIIPQKYPVVRRVKVNKNIMLGYLDEIHGQIGFKGSGKKTGTYMSKKTRSRWSWSIVGSKDYIVCTVDHDGKYHVAKRSL